MTREEALELIKHHVKNKNSIKHMFAVEAVMRSLARRFNEPEEKWGTAGLLHDVDMEKVDYKKDARKHGLIGAQILKEKGVEDDIIEAVMAHNPETGKSRSTKMEKAIFSADPLTGLIIASVLVSPSKKISSLSTESVLKRFKEKSFARGACRETIASCRELDITLEKFVELGLKAMQNISSDLEL